jgi:hypothetical protein
MPAACLRRFSLRHSFVAERVRVHRKLLRKRTDGFTVAGMDTARALLLVLPLQLGCNALTGVNELEPVDCVDCAADAGRDSSSPRDSGIDTGAALDTAARDTGTPTNPVDSASPDMGCTGDFACDDGNACTTDTCTVSTGECTHTVIDMDGDGESPTNLGACGTDCNDNNPSVFSKQTMFFTTAYLTSTGAKSFDYNCDGVDEKQYPALTVCDGSGGGCVETVSGWASSVPACGALAKRAKCLPIFGCARGTAETATAQPCR